MPSLLTLDPAGLLLDSVYSSIVLASVSVSVCPCPLYRTHLTCVSAVTYVGDT